MAPRFEIAVGLRKGHTTTKISAGRKGITDKAIKIRPARLKGIQQQAGSSNMHTLAQTAQQPLLDIKPVQENRVVDPFFLTSTGENYMSLAEPRQADEIKENHKQGNRKSRRAAMFGHVPKFRTQNDNNNVLIKRNGYKKGVNVSSNRQFNYSNQDNQNNPSANKRKLQDKRDDKNNVPEKLHPSWEAKKRMSGIQPFQGKKIVFE